MCGIVGAFYKEAPENDGWIPNDAADILLTASQHRGRDATGWMYPAGKKAVNMVTDNRPANKVVEFLDIPVDAPWWFGHVRFATVGSPDNHLNNHPIRHDDIVGVHNGTIHNYDSVLREAGGRFDPDREVDSEAIFAAIQHFGAEKGLPKLTGGAACAWVDIGDTSVQYLSRVRSYPLIIAKAEDTGNLYFASERRILDELLIPWQKVWTVKPGRMLTVRDGVIKNWKKLDLPPEPKYVYKPSGGKSNSGWTDDDIQAWWEKNLVSTELNDEDDEEFLDWVHRKIEHASSKKMIWYGGDQLTELEYYCKLLDEYYQDTELERELMQH